jgi:uncharacterized membrane protein
MRIRFFDEEKKKMTVIINGDEVTNPVARWVIAGSALVFAVVLIVLLVLIILPLIGVSVAVSLVIAAAALLLIIPLLPLVLLGKWVRGRSDTEGMVETEDRQDIE